MARSRALWHKFDIKLWAEEEDRPPDFEDPRDNAFALGQLKSGNQWGWCVACVKVIDRVTGIDSKTQYLGGCSYRGKADFMKPVGYYEGMVNECIKEVEQEISRLRKILAKRR